MENLTSFNQNSISIKIQLQFNEIQLQFNENSTSIH